MIKRQEKPLDDARADEVMIQGATSVVELQQKVMNQLQEDLDKRVKTIEALYSKQLENERIEWERERSKLESQVAEMSERLAKLEKINKRLLQENESLAKCDHCIAEAAAAQ
jgi:septal ring factor EnvC (AmiA/AmiB activator)